MQDKRSMLIGQLIKETMDETLFLPPSKVFSSVFDSISIALTCIISVSREEFRVIGEQSVNSCQVIRLIVGREAETGIPCLVVPSPRQGHREVLGLGASRHWFHLISDVHLFRLLLRVLISIISTFIFYF